MRSRDLIVWLMALLTGLAAVALAARWLQTQQTTGSQVAVAAIEIPIGSVVTANMLRMVTWPEAARPAGAFDKPDALEGRVVMNTTQPGEPLLESRLAAPGAKGGLSALVAEGKRAITVRVNDVVGVAGFALPGTYVDVLVNTQAERAPNATQDKAISKIVLERILVLAIAQEADRDTTRPKVVNAVTLEVTPTQAELLDLARSVGTLSLVLRNQGERELAATEGVTKDFLLTGVRATAAAVPAPPPPPARRAPPPPVVVVQAPPPPPDAPRQCVEIIRGASKVTECF